MTRSISPFALIGLTSIPIDGATDWITANCPMPLGIVGSQITATRFTLGAISFSSSGHLAGAVAGLVGIERGVVSGVINLESSDVGASDRRPRHDEQYHEL
jgi:hypothetical protein